MAGAKHVTVVATCTCSKPLSSSYMDMALRDPTPPGPAAAVTALLLLGGGVLADVIDASTGLVSAAGRPDGGSFTGCRWPAVSSSASTLPSDPLRENRSIMADTLLLFPALLPRVMGTSELGSLLLLLLLLLTTLLPLLLLLLLLLLLAPETLLPGLRDSVAICSRVATGGDGGDAPAAPAFRAANPLMPRNGVDGADPLLGGAGDCDAAGRLANVAPNALLPGRNVDEVNRACVRAFKMSSTFCFSSLYRNMPTNCVALARGSVNRGPTTAIMAKRVLTDGVISSSADNCADVKRYGTFSRSNSARRSSLAGRSARRDTSAACAGGEINTAVDSEWSTRGALLVSTTPLSNGLVRNVAIVDPRPSPAGSGSSSTQT